MYNPDEECAKIVSAINDICRVRNISQNSLAKKAGMSSSSLSSLLNGRTSPYLYTLLKLCNALDIRLEDVLRYGETGNLSLEENDLLLRFRAYPDYKKTQLHIFMKMLEEFDYEDYKETVIAAETAIGRGV